VIWWRILAFDVLRLKVGKEVFEFSPSARLGVSRADMALRFMREARYRREPLAVSEHVVYYPWRNYIYDVEEPVEAELVREVYAYPFAAYERLTARASHTSASTVKASIAVSARIVPLRRHTLSRSVILNRTSTHFSGARARLAPVQTLEYELHGGALFQLTLVHPLGGAVVYGEEPNSFHVVGEALCIV
jgi:hypothetical protein